MLNHRLARMSSMFAAFSVLALAATAGMTGCGKAAPASQTAQVPQPPTGVAGQPAKGQPLYDTDQQAMAALVSALQSPDPRATVRPVLGLSSGDLSSGDAVADAKGFAHLSSRAKESVRLEKASDGRSIVHMGQEDWPFPFPILRTAEGKWFFDGVEGRNEILARRIGSNELMAIKVCRAYVQAQREYASQCRDNTEVLKYAQRFRSTEGNKDGLYWKTGPDEQQSPFGETITQAAKEGYAWDVRGARRLPYHGYLFRILKKQGPAAPGGKYDYVINGNMIAGFALVAYPDKYGSSGIMTFVVSHQGKVYQKDLGPQTVETASKMDEYNPDGTWTLQD